MIEQIAGLVLVNGFDNKKPDQSQDRGFLDMLDCGYEAGNEVGESEAASKSALNDVDASHDTAFLSQSLSAHQYNSRKLGGKDQAITGSSLFDGSEIDRHIFIEKVNQDLIGQGAQKTILIELRWFATGVMSYLVEHNYVDFNNVNMEVELSAGVQGNELFFDFQQVDRFSQGFAKDKFRQSLVSGSVKFQYESGKEKIFRNERIAQTHIHLQFAEQLKRRVSKVQTDRGVEVYLRDYLSSAGALRELLLNIGEPGESIVKLVLNGRDFKQDISGGNDAG